MREQPLRTVAVYSFLQFPSYYSLIIQLIERILSAQFVCKESIQSRDNRNMTKLLQKSVISIAYN